MDYLWKVNDSQSKAVLLYKFNEDGPLSQSTASLTDVVFSVSMGVAVEKVAMEPTGRW